MQEKLNCNFIFGVENTSVKRLDTSCFNKSIDVPNKPIGNSNWYYQPNLLKLTKEYEVIINDLGVFCISAWLLLLKSKLTKQKIYTKIFIMCYNYCKYIYMQRKDGHSYES